MAMVEPTVLVCVPSTHYGTEAEQFAALFLTVKEQCWIVQQKILAEN